MIATNQKPADENYVRTIQPVPPKGAGGRWKPLPHGDLIDAVKEGARGWRLSRPRYYLSADGADLAASWCVSWKSITRFIPGAVLSLGVRSSNSRKSALTIYGGVRVDAGTVSVVMYADKVSGLHIGSVLTLKEAVNSGLFGWWNGAAVWFAKDWVELEREGVANEPAILQAAGDRKLMPWSWLGRVHEDFARLPNTKWNLLRCFGVHLGRNPPLQQMKQGWGFYQLVKETNP